jgi:hypothetical protein
MVMPTARPHVLTAAALALALSPACGGGSATTPAPVPSAAPGVPVPNEGWAHVPEGTPITYTSNPPASGPHYPVWARWEEHATTVARGYWVHNLEHGGIVLLYRPDAPAAVVASLVAAYRSLPADPLCGHSRALLTADPLLPRATAVVAADFVLLSDGVDAQAIRDFTVAHRNRAPESLCDQGTRP